MKAQFANPNQQPPMHFDKITAIYAVNEPVL